MRSKRFGPIRWKFVNVTVMNLQSVVVVEVVEVVYQLLFLQTILETLFCLECRYFLSSGFVTVLAGG